MRFLKLDARFEDARRIARCLVGSKNETGDEFIALHCGLLLFASTHRSECNTFPIDTLNFCPFVAMREGVFAHGKDSYFEYFGEIENLSSDEEYSLATIGNWSFFTKNEINLDLTPIERGELEGCEIVEVGE